MAKSKGFTVEQKMEMRAAYEQGNILKVIAEKWQVSVPAMSNYIRSVGGTMRNAGTPKKVQDVVAKQVEAFNVNNTPLSGIVEPLFNMPILVPNPEPEITTPQAPVARRILPFE